MAVLKVPDDYPSVQAAVNAAATGDVIKVTNAYTAAETVAVAKDNLIFRGNSQAAVTLDLGASTSIRVAGSLPFAVVAGSNNATSINTHNAAPNTVTGSRGADTLSIGAGDTVSASDGNDTRRGRTRLDRRRRGH